MALRMATAVALRNPELPIMRMYVQEIGRIDALPNGAADTAAPLEPVDTTE